MQADREPLRVVVSGAHGRMGQEVVKAVTGAADMALVGTVDAGGDLAAVLTDTGAQAMVDFTVPSAVLANVITALECKVVPIVGTTGITPDGMSKIRAKCREMATGALIAPNFAIGAVLMMRFAKEAARWMPDAEIVEMHHEKKIDAPSGTALLTAKLIAEGRDKNGPMPAAAEAKGLTGARGAVGEGNVPIHSVRLPGYVASQFVTFGGLGQTLTIRHDTLDRSSFMPGVLIALRSVERIRAARDVMYGLEELLSD